MDSLSWFLAPSCNTKRQYCQSSLRVGERSWEESHLMSVMGHRESCSLLSRRCPGPAQQSRHWRSRGFSAFPSGLHLPQPLPGPCPGPTECTLLAPGLCDCLCLGPAPLFPLHRLCEVQAGGILYPTWPLRHPHPQRLGLRLLHSLLVGSLQLG